MSLDNFFQTIWALLPRDAAQVQAILADQRVLLLCFMLALLRISGLLIKLDRIKSGVLAIVVAAGLALSFVGLQQSAFDVSQGRVFIGGDLAGRGGNVADSLNACESECLSNARCVAFSFDKVLRRCALKAEITRMVTLPGMISGIRRSSSDVRATPPSR